MDSLNKQICRTCMLEAKEDQTLHFIFEAPTANSNQVIADILNTIPRLVIQPEDKLPKMVCMRCLDTLLRFVDFQDMCYLSQCELEQMLGTGSALEAQNLMETKSSLDDQIPMDTVECELRPEPVMLVCNATMLEDVDPLKKNDCLVEESKLEDDGDFDEIFNSEGVSSEEVDKPMSVGKKMKTKKIKRKSTRQRSIECTKIKIEGSIEEPIISTEPIDAVVKSPEMCTKKEVLKTFITRKTPKKRPKKQSTEKLKDALEDSNTAKTKLKYVCEYCNKGFKQSSSLRDHIRVHTGEQPYLCSECGKAFTSSSNMKQHLLRHTGEKKYECPDCPKKFPCLSDLASHKAMHAKIKKHVCDECGAAFGKLSQLKKHNMYHKGEKPHKCEYCPMRFVCADHARRHQRTHTGEKPYKCKYCIRAFAQSNDLIKHLRTHLGENVYRCELCPQGFRLASELRAHFSSHKNDDEATSMRNKNALLEEEAKLRATLNAQKV